MEKQIWKFPIETVDIQEVEMPTGAEILTVQMQREVPCMWALVNPLNEKGKRKFEIFGTGHPVAVLVDRKYIGTYQIMQGAMVFHVFELL